MNRMEAFARRIEEADYLIDREDLIVVYTRDGDPKENTLRAIPGNTLAEQLTNLAAECDDVLCVVDNHGNTVDV